MIKFSELQVKITGEASSLQQVFKELNADLAKTANQVNQKTIGFTKLGASLSGVGKQLSFGVTAPLLAAAVAGTRFANEINGAMANVATLIPGAQNRVIELKKEVQSLAVETGKSSVDIAGGLYEVISAFGDTADTVGILATNTKASVAGLSTVKDAIALTSAVTKGYGDTSTEAVKAVSDLAFLTVKLGQTTFPELAASIGRVVPIASTLKVSQQELFAGFATLTGVTGKAAEVSTQFAGILRALIKPSTEMSAAIRDLGFNSAMALVEQKGFKGALDALIGTTDGSTEAIGKLFTESEALTAVFALSGSQAETYAAKLREMGSAAGATSAAFREQTEGVNKTQFVMNQMTQRVAVLQQNLGQALVPMLYDTVKATEPLVKTVVEAVNAFNDLDASTRKLASGGLVAAAAIGPVVFVLGQMMMGITAAATAVPMMGKAFAAVSGGIAAFVVRVAGVGPAAVLAAGGIGRLAALLASLPALFALNVFEIGRFLFRANDLAKARGIQADAVRSEVESLKILEGRLRANNIEVKSLRQQYKEGALTFDEYRKKLLDLAKAAGNAKVSDSKLAEAFNLLGVKSGAEVKAQAEEAQRALALIKKAFDEGKATAADYAAAQEAVRTATQGVTRDTPPAAAGVSKLTQAFKDLGIESSQEIELRSKKAQDSLRLIEQAYEQGKASAADLVAAQEAVAQAAGRSVEPMVTLMDAIAEVDRRLADRQASREFAEGWWASMQRARAGVDLLLAPPTLEELGHQAMTSAEFVKVLGDELAQASSLAGAFQLAGAVPVGAAPTGQLGAFLENFSNSQLEAGKKAGQKFSRGMGAGMMEISTVFNDLERGLAQVAWRTTKFGEVGKKVAQEFGQAMTRLVLRDALKPILDGTSKLLTQLPMIGKYFGGISSAVPGGAGGINPTGGIGGVAGSAAAGWVGAIGSVATAVSSIVGNFQMSGMNEKLKAIAKHTLQTTTILETTFYSVRDRQDWVLDRLNAITSTGVGVYNAPGDGGLRLAGGLAGGGVAIQWSGNMYGGPAGIAALTDEIVRELRRRGVQLG